DLEDMAGLFENARAELVEGIHSELVESFIANSNVPRTLPQIASSKTAICYLSFVIAPKARGQRRRWKCQKVTTTPTSINKITIGQVPCHRCISERGVWPEKLIAYNIAIVMTGRQIEATSASIRIDSLVRE